MSYNVVCSFVDDEKVLKYLRINTFSSTITYMSKQQFSLWRHGLCFSDWASAAVSGRRPCRPQCCISLLPQQLCGTDQHHCHTHHQPRPRTVHQPAACSRGPPDSQRPAPHTGQFHPHCHVRHGQRLCHAPQPTCWTRPGDGGSWWQRSASVSCALYQSHYSGQPHGSPAGYADSRMEACTNSRGQSGHPSGGGGPESGPRARPSQPEPAAHSAAAERLCTADVQLLSRLEVLVTSQPDAGT